MSIVVGGSNKRALMSSVVLPMRILVLLVFLSNSIPAERKQTLELHGQGTRTIYVSLEWFIRIGCYFSNSSKRTFVGND